MTSTLTAGSACKPNISASGRRRRRLLGIAGFGAALATGVVLIAFHVEWYWRAIGVFVPALVGASGLLQARRSTCIARARDGTFENEDSTTTKMADIDVRASRKVGEAISRDVLVIGVIAAAIAAATAVVPLP